MKVAKGFNCETCGKWHDYAMYVYAHTRDVLLHNCDCGAKHSIVMLTAKQTMAGKKPSPAAPQGQST